MFSSFTLLFDAVVFSTFYTAPLAAPSAYPNGVYGVRVVVALVLPFLFSPAMSISEDASLLMAFALTESDLIYIFYYTVHP